MVKKLFYDDEMRFPDMSSHNRYHVVTVIKIQRGNADERKLIEIDLIMQLNTHAFTNAILHFIPKTSIRLPT